MSLYRQAGSLRPSRLAAGLAACALLGVVIGFAIGRSTASEGDLSDLVNDARSELTAAADALGLVDSHYTFQGTPQGTPSGSARRDLDVQRDGALAQAEAAGSILAAADELRAIDPARFEQAEAAISRLVESIRAEASPSEVSSEAATATAAVEALIDPAAEPDR